VITFGRTENHTLYEKFTHGLEISRSRLEYQNDSESFLDTFKFLNFVFKTCSWKWRRMGT